MRRSLPPLRRRVPEDGGRGLSGHPCYSLGWDTSLSTLGERPKVIALRTSGGAAAASCQSGLIPRASLIVAKASRKAMKTVASRISRSEKPAARSSSTSPSVVAFGFPTTFRAHPASACSRAVSAVHSDARNTAAAVDASDNLASMVPHANAQYESPRLAAAAHTMTLSSPFDNDE